MQKKLVIFSAPSGAGKTTLVNHLLSQDLNLAFSVSACSRKKRAHETHGKDYYFLSEEEFKAKIRMDEFVEWEEVYPDHFYGTLKSEIDRLWSLGMNVIFDVDVVGGQKIKRQYGTRALSVFVMPPSIRELEKRLLLRSTENMENVKLRIKKAGEELKFAKEFDAVIVNDNLETAKKKAVKIVTNFLGAPLSKE
jgi:guanylate kinase